MKKRGVRYMSEKEKKQRKNTIKYNIINSLIAGGLVFFGMISDGSISWQGIVVAAVAAGAVALKNFQDYWHERGKRYVPKKPTGLFYFI